MYYSIKKHLNNFELAKKIVATIFSLSVFTMNLKIQMRFKDQLLSQKVAENFIIVIWRRSLFRPQITRDETLEVK